jgi:predicted phage terminase large subunit-like protein
MAKRKSTGRTIILNVRQEQYATDKREAMILETAHHDVRMLNILHNRYAVRVEQEPGSGGKDSARWTVQNLAGFNAMAIPKTTSKEADWQPIASQVNAGGVEMVVGPWNRDVTQQMAAAPFGKYKDILDALAGGFKYLWLEGYVGVLG